MRERHPGSSLVYSALFSHHSFNRARPTLGELLDNYASSGYSASVTEDMLCAVLVPILSLFCLTASPESVCACSWFGESGPVPALLCLIMRPIYWIIIGSIGGPAVNYCPLFIPKDASAVKVTSFTDTCKDAWRYCVIVDFFLFLLCAKTHLL